MNLIQTSAAVRRRRIRIWLGLFIAGMLLSGVTAFPLQHELDLLAGWLHVDAAPDPNGLQQWIALVRTGLHETYAKYPFIAYGTDWLAFAHVILAILFVGPWREPVRNRWVIDFGLFACVAVVPLAMIAGPVRGIPMGWRLVDCSFGLFGSIPLWIVRRHIVALENGRDVERVDAIR